VTHPSLYPIEVKFEAFGWDTATVDGHDAGAVVAAVRARGTKPLAVVAHTVKGKGVSYMENVPLWHYRAPSPAEYAQALEELERSS
jgi:transketolase